MSPDKISEKTEGNETVVAQTIVLSIDSVKPYERNPRRSENPEYDRIKESIRATGLDQPLVVTQPPESTDYIVHSGGNTRLLALKELYQETSDRRFGEIHCLFKPWVCESEVLLAHLRENDLRGELIFIDKARAIFDIKQLLEEELGIEELSQRKLQSVLETAGYRLNQGLISRMAYTVNRLYPLIPQALNAGLGRPQAVQIRLLDRAACNIWIKYKLGYEGGYDEVFKTLSKRYDSPDWDIGLLQSAIETEISEQADVSIQTIRVELDARIAGRELTIPEFDDDIDADEHDLLHSPESAPSIASFPDDALPHRDENNARPPDEDSLIDAPGSISNPEETTAGSSFDETESTVGQILDSITPAPDDLKSLRGRAWTLAARLAQRNGMSDLVEPISGKGLGFILRDVPDPALADQLDNDALSQVSMVWWHLAASAEMTVAPVASIAPTLPEDSVLRRALEQQDAGLLFNSVWTLDPGHTGNKLWRCLGEQDWSDMLNLMDTYRRIHHLADNTDTRLWE
ncbi:MAG TPA: chromosome partitioning protein ParB [Gammaproteobacteria bacterium]|nr:chromosome partitioning protein ParB [Gammaproteobacteria bacterium]HDZ79254.1 chromosome partitioning protein ParB [Gammaproteobacteria bacterium]